MWHSWVFRHWKFSSFFPFCLKFCCHRMMRCINQYSVHEKCLKKIDDRLLSLSYVIVTCFLHKRQLDFIVCTYYFEHISTIIRWTLSCLPNIVRSNQTVVMLKFVAIIPLFYESSTSSKMFPFQLMRYKGFYWKFSIYDFISHYIMPS